MATVPGQLIWEIVKKKNSFLVKQFGNGTASIRFSKEPNNLCNLHSFKHSGLANKKTVTIQPGKDQSVLFATIKTKKQNKPATALNKALMKKEFHRMAKAVSNQVGDNYYRRDLKKAALARLSVVNRSLKVAKSGAKKKNRRNKGDRYAVVTDRWQKFTDVYLDQKVLDFLANYADEFLVHGVDVEGKKLGIDEELVELLGKHSPIPVTYAGGVTVMADLERIKIAGRGRVDVTVGSALNIFGGNLSYKDVVAWHSQQEPLAV